MLESFVTTANVRSTFIIGPISPRVQLPAAIKATDSQPPKASGIKDKWTTWQDQETRAEEMSSA